MDESQPNVKSSRSPVIIPQQTVRLLQEPMLLGDPSHVAAPEVHVIREGDRIEAIEVVCPCGHCARLRCVYEE